jgi:hypothetical protein
VIIYQDTKAVFTDDIASNNFAVHPSKPSELGAQYFRVP